MPYNFPQSRKNTRRAKIRLLTVLSCAFLLTGALQPATAQEDEPLPQTLFTNVHVFDGVNDGRIENANVLVTGNLIEAVSTDAIDAPGATVIDGNGGTLTPGFIDNHVHFALPGPTIPAHEVQQTWEDMAVNAVTMADMYLKQGVTTVRDAGGQNAGFRRAIDAGLIKGPRIYPSAAFIGPRGGHSDFQPFTANPEMKDRWVF